ncbi:MAG: transglycosylase SLT domain-containing protein [bacterium]|nr:transglycosylase SLT domain-containing protein [bacterium]
MKIFKFFLLISCTLFLFYQDQIIAAEALYNNALYHFYRGNSNTALSILKSIDKDKIPEKILLRSLLYQRKNKSKQAEQTLDQYMEKVALKTGLYDYIRFIKYRNLLLQGRLEEAVKIKKFRKVPVNLSFLGRKAVIELAKYYLKAGQYSQAKIEASSLLKYGKDDVIYPQVLELLVHHSIAVRDIDAALKHYGELIKMFPDKDEEDILWRRIKRSFRKNIVTADCFTGVDEHYQYLNSLFYNSLYTKIQKQARYIIAVFPQSRNLYDVYFKSGYSYFYQYRYRHALSAFQALLKYKVPRKKNEETRYYIAASLLALGSRKTANNEFIKLNKNMPDNRYKAEALYNICSYYKKQGPYQVYRKYKDIFRHYYSNTDAYKKYFWNDNIEELKWNYNVLTEKQFRASFARLLSIRIINKIQSWYRKLYGSNKTKKQILYEGVRRIPVSYYTARILKKYFSNASVDKLDQKYQLLYRMGLGELAAEESAYLESVFRQNNHKEILQNIILLDKMGEHNKVIKILNKRFSRYRIDYGSLPAGFIPYLYPLVNWGTVKRYADKYKVDPYLIMAVMRESSYFNKNKKTGTGALGLMQITPDVGRHIAARAGQYWDASLILQDDKNIKFATFYLSWLNKAFSGDLHYVICAYKSGHRLTRRWQGEFGTKDFDLFTSMIPYSETRDYMRRVMSSYIIYKMLYS